MIKLKTKHLYYGIIISLAFILFGSVNHIAYAFGTLEKTKEANTVAIILALGTEIAMLMVGFGMAERRRNKQSAKDLIFYLFCFAIINFYGNIYHAISVYKGEPNLKMVDVFGDPSDPSSGIDKLILFTSVFFSGTLPLIALALTELQSIYAYKILKEQQEIKNAELKAERKRRMEQAALEKREARRLKKLNQLEKIAELKKQIIEKVPVENKLAVATRSPRKEIKPTVTTAPPSYMQTTNEIINLNRDENQSERTAINPTESRIE